MRKLLISILSVALGAALIYGATMAWFTDEAEVAPTTFTAGTVDINVGDTIIEAPAVIDNVNPGDNFDVTWYFTNDGTKSVKIRVLADIQYIASNGQTQLPTSNLTNLYLSDGWYSENNFQDEDDAKPGLQLTLYYDPAIPGTYGDATEDYRTVSLTVSGTFDGLLTGNEYQASVLTISGTVQAIQASHSSDVEDGGWNWANFDSYN